LPFPEARSSMKMSIEACREDLPPVTRAFLKFHIELFEGTNTDLTKLSIQFLHALQQHIGQNESQFGVDCSFMAMTNITAIFGYASDSPIRRFLDIENYLLSLPAGEGKTTGLPEDSNHIDHIMNEDSEIHTFDNSCNFFNNTLSVLLSDPENPSVLAHTNLVLTFITKIAEIQSLGNPALKHAPFDSVKFLEQLPIEALCRFLNHLLAAQKHPKTMDPDQHIGFQDGDERHCILPEDLLMRGQIWCKDTFLPGFFDQLDRDSVERETDETIRERKSRVIWLGMRLAKFGYLKFGRASMKFYTC